MAETPQAFVAAFARPGQGSRQAVAARTRAARDFLDRFGSAAGWQRASLDRRLAAPGSVRGVLAWAAATHRLHADADYLADAVMHWGPLLASLHPQAHHRFTAAALDLGFSDAEVKRQWRTLGKLALLADADPDTLSGTALDDARRALADAVKRRNAGAVPPSLAAPLFGLPAVLFHLGQTSAPPPSRGPTIPTQRDRWEPLRVTVPDLAATMLRYLDQLRLSLRPSSVALIDTSLRTFAGYLADQHPDVTAAAHVTRAHVESYKGWLATRPGYRSHPRQATSTLGYRVGHLRGFFDRIIEWGYPDAPARSPLFAGDLPIRDRPLPRFLDDATAAKLLAAARAHPDPFTRLAVQMLARTGMRKGELLGLTVDALVQIGANFWLRLPVGKLHSDRYVPLHPQLKTLLDDWLADRPDRLRSQLLFTERGRRIASTRVDAAVHDCARRAGLPHTTPHQLRHTLATQAINRGMSLEAIAALLGHRSLTMTMTYARIADRTVAEQYFAVTEQVEALYEAARADEEGAHPCQLPTEANQRLLGNGFCARPDQLDCQFETICEACAFFRTTLAFRSTLAAQRDQAAAAGHAGRQRVYDQLLTGLDGTSANNSKQTSA
ncbi:MAG: tyrosine-type recombinase/integrase [Frankiaceae bacterium]